MKVIELHTDSPREQKQGFMDLNAEFNAIYGRKSSQAKLESSLNNLLTSDVGAHGWLALDEEGVPVAMCYFNLGASMVSGGNYLWLNGIHVTESARRKGYGTELLGHLVDWARGKGLMLIVCLRDEKNVRSRALFDRLGFEYEDTVIMDKVLV